MGEKVRIGIIGMGNMGTGHSNNILQGKCPELTITAVADLNPERLEWAKEHLPDAVRYESGDALIENAAHKIVDAVLVAGVPSPLRSASGSVSSLPACSIAESSDASL